MACRVPDDLQGERFHIIRPHCDLPLFEIAEWVACESNGPTERGHWVRWGYCGDFPSLCRADYLGPYRGAYRPPYRGLQINDWMEAKR